MDEFAKAMSEELRECYVGSLRERSYFYCFKTDSLWYLEKEEWHLAGSEVVLRRRKSLAPTGEFASRVDQEEVYELKPIRESKVA